MYGLPYYEGVTERCVARLCLTLLCLQIVCIRCHCLHTGIKNHHLKLSVYFLAQFDASFHCPENVDKYKVVF